MKPHLEDTSTPQPCMSVTELKGIRIRKVGLFYEKPENF